MCIPFVDDFQKNNTALHRLFNRTNPTDVNNIAMFANCIISFFIAIILCSMKKMSTMW